MLAVTVQSETTFGEGRPKVLFKFGMLSNSGANRPYDITRDGQFIIIRSDPVQNGDGAPSNLILVQQLDRGAEVSRADEVIAAYVTHSRRQSRFVTSRAVFGDPPRTRSNRDDPRRRLSRALTTSRRASRPSSRRLPRSVTNVMRRLPTSPHEIRRDDVSRAARSTRWRGDCLQERPARPGGQQRSKRAACVIVNTAQWRA